MFYTTIEIVLTGAKRQARMFKLFRARSLEINDYALGVAFQCGLIINIKSETRYKQLAILWGVKL